jgi:hypothetical protein
MHQFAITKAVTRPIVIVLGLLVGSGTAHAATLVTYEFAGVIDQSYYSFVNIGEPFSGAFTYDLDAIDQEPGDPEYGYYVNEAVPPPGLPVGLSYAVGPLSFRTEYVEVEIYDDNFEDSVSLMSDDPLTGPAGAAGAIYLTAAGHDVITSDRPPAMLNLANFSSAELWISVYPACDPREPCRPDFVSGNIETLRLVSIVPEPASIAMFLSLGFGCLGIVRRTQRLRETPPHNGNKMATNRLAVEKQQANKSGR